MEYNKLIAGMHTGDDVEGFYVLKDAFLKTTAAGKPFLSGVLADRSGTFFARQRTQTGWRLSRTITQRKAGRSVLRACVPLSADANNL